MQLNKNLKYRPVLVSAGLAAGVPVMQFQYQDFDNMQSAVNVVIQNPETSDYVKRIDAESYGHFYYEALFQDYYQKWKQETRFSSSVNTIVENEGFRSIVEMKENAVPFILAKIKEGPTLLVWALNLIYDTKVSQKSDITIEEAGKLWMKKLQS